MAALLCSNGHNTNELFNPDRTCLRLTCDDALLRDPSAADAAGRYEWPTEVVMDKLCSVNMFLFS
jgi:hypothetical protein